MYMLTEAHRIGVRPLEDMCVRGCGVVCGPGRRRQYNESLRAGRSGGRIIQVGASFAPVQTGPRSHLASYTMCAGSFPGVKRSGRGVDHPPPFSAKVKESVELYSHSPSGPSWPVLW